MIIIVSGYHYCKFEIAIYLSLLAFGESEPKVRLYDTFLCYFGKHLAITGVTK